MTASKSRTSKWPLWALVIVVGTLAAITVWMRMIDTGTPAADSAGSVQDAGDPSRVADDQAARDSLASRRQRAATPMDAAAMRERMQQSKARRERQREEQARRSEASKQQAVATYRAERVDPAWAPGKETELDTIAASPAIAQANIDPKSLEIDCKRTMCRLNGTFATSSAADDWTMLYMSSVGNAMPNSVVTRTVNPDGTISVEIYGRAR